MFISEQGPGQDPGPLHRPLVLSGLTWEYLDRQTVPIPAVCFLMCTYRLRENFSFRDVVRDVVVRILWGQETERDTGFTQERGGTGTFPTGSIQNTNSLYGRLISLLSGKIGNTFAHGGVPHDKDALRKFLRQ